MILTLPPNRGTPHSPAKGYQRSPDTAALEKYDLNQPGSHRNHENRPVLQKIIQDPFWCMNGVIFCNSGTLW